MLPLHSPASVQGARGKSILKILTAEEAATSGLNPADILIWADDLSKLPEGAFPFAGVAGPGDVTAPPGKIAVGRPKHAGVIAPGDVIRTVEGSQRVSVLYRRGSNANTLFATERCNSHCVMCSQPPREVDDGWLVDEMLAVIPLVDPSEEQLGISGGEPTLLGDDLLMVLLRAKEKLPATGLHVLSNGRRFADKAFARCFAAVRHPYLTWGIPLYSASPEVHDYIVQSPGAWGETVRGLYNLARHGSDIEIRVVVQRANVDELGELASFIFRNLTFASHVAFMGLEPMGFARTNRDAIWVDPSDAAPAITDAVFFLANRGMTVSVYNYPLCTMPEVLWPYCRQSISDWKNRYLPVCDGCAVRGQCAGFFRSVGPEWVGRGVKPIARRVGVAIEEREVAG